MAERLVILSDLWGAKKGLWITSYLGYLQQYFDIVYYDSSQLAEMKLDFPTSKNISEAFEKGGMERAVKNLLSKENEDSHYLTFCVGGTIAWHAALKGLPVRSIYSVSPILLHREEKMPGCPVTLVYGEYAKNRPSREWAIRMGATMEIIPRFGQECYSDEKIIQKVSKDLLSEALKNQFQRL